jgi:spermidine/putrescine transport system substrate-binding protein
MSKLDLDGALVRGLTERRVSRRQVLRGAGAGALGLGAGSILAACGVSGTKNSGTAASFDWSKQTKQGTLDWANWPLYIDTEGGKHQSIDMFTAKTGIKVNYKPVIQDNAPFFAQISPALQAGQGIGYDLIVISDGWELTQLMENGWLIPLDHTQLPNFRKYAGDAVRTTSYDPDNTYTAVWQSGLTGIGYNPKLTGRRITSIQDLWDPAFKGKVGMMSDNTELGSAGLLKLGIDPKTSTPDDWNKAAEVLKQQRDDGLVRQYYDQSYIKALQDGDVALTQAWTGDIFQSQNSGFPDLEFVVPDEGVMVWHDNCMIPQGAKHPVDALEWINFYYQPQIEAIIEDWVNYICPVPASQSIIRNQLQDPVVANSPLVFPTPAIQSKFVDYYTFKGVDDHQEWNSTFDPIIQS